MRLLGAFLKLVRFPNLIFIALTQVLFQFCIYNPIYNVTIPQTNLVQFILLVVASLLIAGGGYIINDYFDINIDQVNKPEKLVVDKIIRRRWAIVWHLVLSFMGILCTALALPFHKWYLVLANILCVSLLWFYSTTFKKNLLVGNIVIAILVAWSILIFFFSKLSIADAFGSENPANFKFFRFAFLYAGFAFIISLIREAIKDIEDREGDAKYGCRTMPIVWGVSATKVYIAVWLIVLLAAIIIIQVYILQFQWWWVVVYSVFFIIVPLVLLFAKLFPATTQKQFHQLSNLAKLSMLTGILSMLMFRIYL